MPSKTRARATKASKENIGVVKTKAKATTKVPKVTRKPLSDKTNSASDDNASVVSDKTKKPVASVQEKQINDVFDDNGKRPRRARRLPNRFKENNTLKNLSNSFNLSTSKLESPAFKTPSPVLKKAKVVNNVHATNNTATKVTVLAKKITSPVKNQNLSPSKSPVQTLDCSILKNRPKRICRLPSKFEDHSISPNKYIPLQPINASTPFATKTKKLTNNVTSNVSAILKNTAEKLSNTTSKTTNKRNAEKISALQTGKIPENQPKLSTKNINNGTTVEIFEPHKRPKRATKAKKMIYEIDDSSVNISPAMPTKRATRQKAANNVIRQINAADTNNNAKKNKAQESSSKSPDTPGKIFKSREKVLYKNTSLKLVDDKNNQLKRDSSKLDVYEFTFDPDEEPPPAKKKKKKKTAPRKPKPKTVPLKSKYDRNLAKALADLKNTIATKSSNTQNGETNINREATITFRENLNKVDDNQINTPINERHLSVITEQSVNEKNYNSVRVEDIARDFHMEDHAVDYSPVNSPTRTKTPTNEVPCNVELVQTPNNIDPLNLRDESFFDEIPVASSSMNVSVKHPQASPWRAEFGNLPIKWHTNTYVKPNMTPAMESSFINFNDTKKKHVYTNMVPEANDPIPEVDNSSNLKQTSIISFIKEVVERNANKKNKKSTPIKANSLFEDLTSTSIVDHKTPNKETPFKNHTNVSITPESGKHGRNGHSDMTNEKENSDNTNNNKVKTPKDFNKNADKNNTYFGFDEIEDQENVSPFKKNERAKSLRSRTRGILQEINDHKGPTRGVILVAAKSKPAQNTVYINEMKSATEPPVFPEVAVNGNTETTNVQETCVSENLENEDQSVHLFEDIDLLFIHHPKPSRKSYGKTKKVTFIQNPVVGSDDSSMSDQNIGDKNAPISSEEDNLDDLSYRLPADRPKKTIKKKPKKQLSKKEEKEVEAWAAGFNSMCEDIEGFDLVVE